MATNIIHTGSGVTMKLDCGGAKSSGDWVQIAGVVNGVCLTDTDSSDYATVLIPRGFVADLAVTGADGSGNAAITAPAAVYKDSTAINADVTNGTLFGVALEDVASGATTTVQVLVI